MTFLHPKNEKFLIISSISVLKSIFNGHYGLAQIEIKNIIEIIINYGKLSYNRGQLSIVIELIEFLNLITPQRNPIEDMNQSLKITPYEVLTIYQYYNEFLISVAEQYISVFNGLSINNMSELNLTKLCNFCIL